jgi:hypothetical protein
MEKRDNQRVTFSTGAEDDHGFAVLFKKMELDSYIILKNIVFYADEELHEFQEFL